MAMRELPADRPAAASGRALPWDALAAVIASLIGLLALGVAGYTAYLQRQQVRAEVWPYLLWASSDVATQYMWINKGVGPAIVHSAQVLVGGKPQRNWKAVFQSLGLEDIDYGQSTFSGNVLSAGETLQWLTFPSGDDFRRFRAAAARAKLEFRACYCSTLGECWRVRTPDWTGADRAPLDSCPAVPDGAQFDD